MKTLILTALTIAAILSFTGCETTEGTYVVPATTSTTTTTEETTTRHPSGGTTHTQTTQSY